MIIGLIEVIGKKLNYYPIVVKMATEIKPENQDSGQTPLKQKLVDDLKKVMREGDKVKRLVIRSVLAAIKNAEIARQSNLEDTDILGVIAKEVRQRRESIEAFKQGTDRIWWLKKRPRWLSSMSIYLSR